MAQLEDPGLDPEEVYARYKGWLPFAVRTDTFIRDSAVDLGYDPDRLSWRNTEEEKG